MSSRRSSESGTSVDSEVILEAERLETERLALKELESTISKPVAFAVRTNISFDGTLHGTDAPSPSYVVSFESREFLHVKKRFNRDWWIGRRVHIGSSLGFIPSASKLETIQISANTASSLPYFHAGGQSGMPGNMAGSGMLADQVSGGNNKRRINDGGTGSTEGTLERGKARGVDSDHRFPAFLANRQRQSESPPPGEFHTGLDGYDDTDEYRDGQYTMRNSPPHGISTSVSKKGQIQLPGQAAKRRGFSRKPEFVAPYEIVPCMRPVVFVGPALKGYDITDMMQKAIFDAMKKHFDGRIIVSRISTNISLAKRVGALLHLDKKNLKERSRNEQLFTLLAVQKDLEKIFHLASKMQLLLLDCDTINHPNQISKTCLAPIIIYIKISSIRVLNRLIKTRGKLQKKNAGVQTASAEKLLQCPNESFEFIVEQNTLGAATEALCHFLEGYWEATHPPIALSKVERLLGSKSLEQNEPDSDRPLVPITPGHPGLSVVTKSALSAGFTSQEITALTGARAAGWITENGAAGENELGLTGARHAGGTTEIDYSSELGRQNDYHGEQERENANVTLHSSSRNLNDRHIHVGAAHAAAMVAMAAGLSPRIHTGNSNLAPSRHHMLHGLGDSMAGSERSSPGLAMGIGMGLASGVAATINAALFQRSPNDTVPPENGPVFKVQPHKSTVAAAAAAIRPPPLEELGIHQVQRSDGTHVYQSRSARQAKQREAELERVRREAQAKALAIQSTVAGRRRRRRDRRPRDGGGVHESPPEWQMSFDDRNTDDRGNTRIHLSETKYSEDWCNIGPTLNEMTKILPLDDNDDDD